MNFSRMILHITLLAFCVASTPVQARGFWDSASRWFSRQRRKVERATDKAADGLVKATRSVAEKVRSAGEGARDAVSNQITQKIIEPMIKPTFKRTVKTVVDEAEKHVKPIIDKTEKQIYKNAGQKIARYCAAGLGGIVAFALVRQAATRMVKNSEEGLGGWLRKQNEGSTLAADAVIGTLLGIGLFGLSESEQ